MSVMTRERFLSTVSTHQLNIIKDDGLFRHLEVRKPTSGDRHYNITTWPNYLCISGDMGCFVFSRVEDMFRFFRSPELRINEGYWAEKCKAQSIYGDGLKQFDPDILESTLREAFDQYAKDVEWTEEEIDIEWDKVQEDILTKEDPSTACEAIWSFISGNDWAESVFQDISFDFTSYTSHYLWCCYAIAHAINLYDQQVEKKDGSI